MSEIIERVAARIYAMDNVGSPTTYEGGLREGRKDIYRKQAREVIKAMREPTEAMCEAWAKIAADRIMNGVEGKEPKHGPIDGAAECYRAMIDVALGTN